MDGKVVRYLEAEVARQRWVPTTALALVKAGAAKVALPVCRRTWQLRARRPHVPCGDDDDCSVCGRFEARHEQALRKLEKELDKLSETVGDSWR